MKNTNQIYDNLPRSRPQSSPVLLCAHEGSVELLEDLLRDVALGPGLVEARDGAQVVALALLGGLLLLLVVDVVVVVGGLGLVLVLVFV